MKYVRSCGHAYDLALDDPNNGIFPVLSGGGYPEDFECSVYEFSKENDDMGGMLLE